ncbi:MAG: hypothetical protein K2W88_19350, partial [Pararheinheimera sp.]|nr:hypothetical protein [Rheinheimera sp.]
MKVEQFESIYSHQDFLWIRRENSSEFTVVQPSTVKPHKPFEEAVRSAILISERSPDKKISLCLSGGMDSECMLMAYMAAGVKFEVAIMRFKDGLNAHDIESAEVFCRE